MESTSHSESSHVNGEVEDEKTHPITEGPIISTIPPQLNGFLSPEAFGLFQYEGFWYHIFYLEGVRLAQKQFTAQPTDLIISSVPKSGTTWLKALAFAIVTRTQYDFSTNPLLVTMPHDCVPLLEVDIIHNPAKQNNPKIPLLSTHIPHSSLPNSIIASGCKIVYICREPKDAFVSFYHFICKVRPELKYVPFEIVFEMFCGGISYYGPYWDHILGYWKASLEQPERVLFLKYEDMKRDTSVHVKRLAEFIGHPFSSEEESQGAVEKIVKLCSFENLSNLEVNKIGKHRADTPVAIDNTTYFRKGEVGDWKNHLTAEMIKRMDQITEQKLGSVGLTFHAAPEPEPEPEP